MEEKGEREGKNEGGGGDIVWGEDWMRRNASLGLHDMSGYYDMCGLIFV